MGAATPVDDSKGYSCDPWGETIDAHSRYTWHRVIGWERKGAAGGSDIALREKRDGWAHPHCVSVLQQGRSPGQASLL